MLSKVLILFCSVVFVCGLYEGDICEQDGLTGKCVLLKNCQTAMQNIRNRKPQICGFVGTDPIVCCLDNNAPSSTTKGPKPTAPVSKKPVSTTADPDDYDYGEEDRFGNECEPVPTSLTAPKNGRKAWDKCIDYQESLVFPCETSVALTGDKTRVNKCGHKADELIVGGVEAAVNEFPHMAMIGFGEKPELQWLCGGSIISENFILTAGHCIADHRVGNATHIVVGVHTRADAENESKVYRIKRVVKHPGYKPPAKYNDIALMETDKPIKLDQYTVPACLNTGNAANDDKASATGWGLTVNRGKDLSQVLQKVILSKFSTKQCSDKFSDVRNMKRGFDENTQICYGDYTASKDTCEGDSGGPLQIKSRQLNCMYMIVGVTSFGKACGFVGDPGIYTRVESYVPWIESVVWP